MSNSLCPCSKLEWLPEHYSLEHHPDCQQVEIDAPPVGGFDSIPFGAIPFDGSPDHLYIRLTDGNGNHSPTYKVKVSPAQDDVNDSAPWIYPAQAPQLIERRIHLATLAANPDWCISIPIKNAPGYPIKSVNLWRKKKVIKILR